MKLKLNKIAKALAIGVFFMALFLNIKISLENPFIRMDSAALAQTSSNGYVCCPSINSYCVDRFGTAYADTISKLAPCP